MLSLRRLILTLGLANLIVLSLIACGDDGVASDPDLERRIERLESWRLRVEQRDASSTAFMRTQHELNQVVQSSLTQASESAVRTEAAVTRQRAALNQLADIVKDILQRK
jgi:hypothetical protein